MRSNLQFYRRLASIALPIAGQQLIISSLNMVDTLMISSLTEASIAGVGAANKFYFLYNLFLFGLNSGSAVLNAQFWGKRDTTSIKKVFGITLTLALSVGFLFSLVAIVFPKFVLGIFSPDPLVIAEGAGYLRIVGWSYLFTALSFSISFALRTTNNVILPLLVTLVAISLNSFGNWVLIFGHFGLPALGVEGAACSTVFARIVECSLLIFSVYRLKMPIAGHIREFFSYDKKLFKRFARLAFPVVANEMLWSSGMTMYTVIFGHMGTQVMASVTITQTVEQIVFVLSAGIGNACGIILGNALGAEDQGDLFEDAKSFVRINFLLGVIMGLLLIFAAPLIAEIYRVNDVIYYNIIATMTVYGVFLGFKSINMVTIVGILRSGGDTIFAALLDAGGVWAIGVPLTALTGLVLKWDISFVYIAVMVEELVKLGFGLYRMNTKKWMNNLVEEAKT